MVHFYRIPAADKPNHEEKAGKFLALLNEKARSMRCFNHNEPTRIGIDFQEEGPAVILSECCCMNFEHRLRSRVATYWVLWKG